MKKPMNAARTIVVAALGSATCLAAAAAAGANLDAGHAKAKEVCAACHGENGDSATPDYPKLAGQHADYLAKALRDYKSGLRKNPIMAGMAAGLSKQDIDNVAAYYAAQPRVLSVRH
jgi:cytochrome c553